MSVCIDQAGSQHHSFEFELLLRRMLECFLTRCDEYDASITDAQSMPLEHYSRWLDRNQRSEIEADLAE